MKLKSASGTTANGSTAIAYSDCPKDDEVKPFSEIPTDNTHWIVHTLRILFTNGGLKKSLYKIQEDTFR